MIKSAAKDASKVTRTAIAAVKKRFPDVSEKHITRLIAHYGSSAKAIAAIKSQREYMKVFGI